jgi:hypothetical protein
MARSFNGTSDNIVKNSGTLFNGFPLTLACWFKADNVTSDGGLVYMGRSTNNGDRVGLATVGTTAGDPIVAQHIDNNLAHAGLGNAFSTTGFSAGVWHHACGVFTSSSSRTVYLDGGNSAINTDPQDAIAIDRTSIGNLERLTPALFFAGDIMEVGIWHAALTVREVISLARGFAPSLVRPTSLVCYLQLIGKNDPEINYWRTGDQFIVNGATHADHGRVFYPASPIVGRGQLFVAPQRRYNVFVAT